jgi:hypothetical protein
MVGGKKDIFFTLRYDPNIFLKRPGKPVEISIRTCGPPSKSLETITYQKQSLNNKCYVMVFVSKRTFCGTIAIAEGVYVIFGAFIKIFFPEILPLFSSPLSVLLLFQDFNIIQLIFLKN